MFYLVILALKMLPDPQKKTFGISCNSAKERYFGLDNVFIHALLCIYASTTIFTCILKYVNTYFYRKCQNYVYIQRKYQSTF